MRRIILLLCLLSPLLAHAGGQYRLTKIVVTGSSRYKDSDLVRATGLTLNAQVTLDDLQNAAARMGSVGVFSSVQFAFKPAGGANSVEADYTVKDSDRFLPARFENVIWFTDPELESALHDILPLYNGMLPVSGTMTDDVAAALKKILSAKGLPSDVSYLPRAELGKPPSSYNYKVNNAGLKIGPIYFVGASQIAPNLLAQSVASLAGRDYLRTDVETVFKKNLLSLYLEHGFLQATLGEIRPMLNNGRVEIGVTVSEGTQYRLAGYSWSGNTLVSSDELSRHIMLKPGEPVNAIKLERDLNWNRRLFGKFGHEAATISPAPTFDGNTVSYRFEVNEGDTYHMGRVEVSGVAPDVSQKLLESWKLPEGAPYDSGYPLQFNVVLARAARSAGVSGQWEVNEHIDDTNKIVDVVYQLR
ncbi:MAG TPA: POTRA domain-containing protein [Candidatus Angelobacter sp.]|nr:POTRA domain-containing protein [Candidatus Angelobacter sp.]